MLDEYDFAGVWMMVFDHWRVRLTGQTKFPNVPNVDVGHEYVLILMHKLNFQIVQCV